MNKIIDRKNIINRIRSRRKILKNACKELKRHFCGLDNIIDRIGKYLEPWYCFPELLTRPLIICLWGATGTGKTDLVRRLVKLLDFQDRFCEVEMMNKGNFSTYSWHSSISSILSSNPKIESGQPSVLLLDEIQNFRTINEEGDELSEYKYRDVWTLLSDGKLPYHVELDQMLQLLWEYIDREKREKEVKIKKNKIPKFTKNTAVMRRVDDITIDDKPFVEDDENEEPMDENDLAKPLVDDNGEVALDDNFYVLGESDSYYTLKHFKAILRLTEPLEEIAKWSLAKRKAMIIEKLNATDIYEEVDYTKCLIFVSGNLDEAYGFAKKTNEVDVNADIFHDLSLKINILDIKKALGKRFKPEQIARFGNTQIIYPTLNKNSYETIIQRKIRDIQCSVKNNIDIKLEVDGSINDLIYKNGVYPTQGTRPVFSTISEIMEAPLPTFLLKAFTDREKSIRMFYEKNNICAKFKKTILRYPYRGALDKLKFDRNKNPDKRILNAVHEAGHAIVYASLFKCAPPQISALTASQDIGGFIWVHEICGSKALIEDRICSMMAGGAAESFMFGSNNQTWGMEDDLHEATKLAGCMVRHYGMGKNASYVSHPQRSDLHNTDLDSTNPFIEEIISDALLKATEVIKQNLKIFNDVVDFLMSHKDMSPQNFRDICARHNLHIIIKKSEDILYSNYHQQYRAFKKAQKRS